MGRLRQADHNDFGSFQTIRWGFGPVDLSGSEEDEDSDDDSDYY